MRERGRPTGWGTVWLGSLTVLVGVAGLASALSPTPAPIAGAAPRPAVHACADADGDGLVTVTDGVVTLRAAAGLPSPCDLFRCDLDLRAVFGAIETYEAPLPICEVVAIDPCVINQLDWDDFGATDFECHGPWVGSVAPVTDVLDALVASP